MWIWEFVNTQHSSITSGKGQALYCNTNMDKFPYLQKETWGNKFILCSDIWNWFSVLLSWRQMAIMMSGMMPCIGLTKHVRSRAETDSKHWEGDIKCHGKDQLYYRHFTIIGYPSPTAVMITLSPAYIFDYTCIKNGTFGVNSNNLENWCIS